MTARLFTICSKNILSDNRHCPHSTQSSVQKSKSKESYLESDIKITSNTRNFENYSHGAVEHNNKDSNLFSIR